MSIRGVINDSYFYRRIRRIYTNHISDRRNNGYIRISRLWFLWSSLISSQCRFTTWTLWKMARCCINTSPREWSRALHFKDEDNGGMDAPSRTSKDHAVATYTSSPRRVDEAPPHRCTISTKTITSLRGPPWDKSRLWTSEVVPRSDGHTDLI